MSARRDSSRTGLATYQPPHEPWRKLKPKESAGGFLSYYISDDLSPIAVRGVTLPANNKSDPNLETGTYGLFSICGHGMRASIVSRGCPIIVFLTRRSGRRVLTGYYRIGWYAPGPVSSTPPDYSLAATVIRFVDPPIELNELPRRERVIASKAFRVFKWIDQQTVDRLVGILNRRPDATAAYLAEIARLERFNEFRTGFKYVNWRKTSPWTWADADQYLSSNAVVSKKTERAQKSEFWQCGACGASMFSKARLKRCPECGAFDSLSNIEPPGPTAKP